MKSNRLAANKGKTFSFLLLSLIILTATREIDRATAAEVVARDGATGAPALTFASADLVANLQTLMGTEIGGGLASRIPSLSLLQNFSPKDFELRASVGYMAAHFSPAPGSSRSGAEDFNVHLAAALKSPKENAVELAALADMVAVAHDQAAPEVGFIMQGAVEEYAASVAAGLIQEKDLSSLSTQLKYYALYGPVVTANPKVKAFKELTAQPTMQAARLMAVNLIQETHVLEEDQGFVFPRRISPPVYSREAVLAAIPQLSARKDAQSSGEKTQPNLSVAAIPGSVAAAPLDGDANAAKERQLILKFKATFLLGIGNVNIEASVEDADIAKLLKKYGLTLREKRADGAYRVEVPGNRAVSAVREDLTDESMIASVMSVTDEGARVVQ